MIIALLPIRKAYLMGKAKPNLLGLFYARSKMLAWIARQKTVELRYFFKTLRTTSVKCRAFDLYETVG